MLVAGAGIVERDIDPDLHRALKSRQAKRRAFIVEPTEVGRLLLAIDAYEGSHEICHALRLALLVFVRPGELRHAEWAEISWNEGLWSISADKMKMREDHFVPLSRQALKILRGIQQFTGNCRYVFPSARSHKRPMSDNALRIALRTMGYTNEQVTPHSFRAMARTLLDEQLGFRVDYIEYQLAHAVKNSLGQAYNRTKHLPERHEMMQKWADYLDKLKSEAEAVANTR